MVARFVAAVAGPWAARVAVAVVAVGAIYFWLRIAQMGEAVRSANESLAKCRQALADRDAAEAVRLAEALRIAEKSYRDRIAQIEDAAAADRRARIRGRRDLVAAEAQRMELVNAFAKTDNDCAVPAAAVCLLSVAAGVVGAECSDDASVP